MKISEPKTPGTLWATLGLLRDTFTFTCKKYCFYNKWQLFWLKFLFNLVYETQLDVYSKEYLNQATTTANSAFTL
jgi:hypothetical protein